MLKTFEISPKMLRKIERKKMKNGDMSDLHILQKGSARRQRLVFQVRYEHVVKTYY